MDHDRTKHIDTKYKFIKKEIDDNHIKIVWVSSDKQLADIFTKALGVKIYTNIRDTIMRRISRLE